MWETSLRFKFEASNVETFWVCFFFKNEMFFYGKMNQVVITMYNFYTFLVPISTVCKIPVMQMKWTNIIKINKLRTYVYEHFVFNICQFW